MGSGYYILLCVWVKHISYIMGQNRQSTEGKIARGVLKRLPGRAVCFHVLFHEHHCGCRFADPIDKMATVTFW